MPRVAGSRTLLLSVCTPHLWSSPKHSTSDPGYRQERQLLAWGPMCKKRSIPIQAGMEHFVPMPTRKFPKKTSTFLGPTFSGLTWLQGTCYATRCLAASVQAASGRSPFGQPAGKHPMAAPRPPQSAHLITLCVCPFMKQLQNILD